MLRPRVIPVLLLDEGRLVKTTRFSKPVYVGDPINAVKIFNDKEVDEIVFLDISATKNGTEPSYDLVYEIATECFMPLCYGGGVKSYDQAQRLIENGAEKIAFNTALFERPNIVSEVACKVGSSSVVASVDVRRGIFGKPSVFVNCGRTNTKISPIDFCARCEELGVGEILLHVIDRDGTQSGYDIELIKSVSAAVSVPVIACGGASSCNDFELALTEGGASAVAAGSMFVFYGKHRAVLINYPNANDIERLVGEVRKS